MSYQQAKQTEEMHRNRRAIITTFYVSRRPSDFSETVIYYRFIGFLVNVSLFLRMTMRMKI